MNEPLPSRRVVLALLGGLLLGACGRKGPPVSPPDADPLAPRVYPVDRQHRRRQGDEEPLPPQTDQPPPLPPTPSIPR